MPINFFNIFVSIIAVVFVFLFAVQKFSRQINYLEGNKFKNILANFTSKPIYGVFTGTVITSILQSSTAVTVMLVSLVHGGILTFESSLGIIIGANIGTTITTQLVALKILNIAPYVLILGFFIMKWKGTYQKYGKSIFYFGLIFSCLFLMSVLVAPLQDSSLIASMIAKTSNIFIAILVGFLLANILQSSSITTALIVIFASSNLLDFSQAFGIILGANIGTTTTALIASLVVDKHGKRVAVAHFLFNLLGVIIFFPFINIFTNFIVNISLSTAQHVAMAHLIFNLIMAVIFLIWIKPFTRLIYKIIP